MREHAGKGDPAKTMALLWRTARESVDAGPARRGPKPALDVEDIVARAMAIADAEGLDAVSVRRVAEEMGVSAMSLYTYVPGKGELFELMVDRALGEQPLASVSTRSGRSGTTSRWRRALERYARETRALFDRHPWLLQVASARAVLGPHVVARLDAALGTLDETALRAREKVAIVSLIDGYVRGAAAQAIDAREARGATGESDDAWWQARAALLDARFEAAFAEGRFRHIAAIARDGGFDERGASADGESHSQRRAREEFTFGLARVLDGIAALIDARTARPPARAKRQS